MSKYKVTYHATFGNSEEIIDADSLEDAEEIAKAKSVYRYITVEETDEVDAESRCEFCGEADCKNAECEDDY